MTQHDDVGAGTYGAATVGGQRTHARFRRAARASRIAQRWIADVLAAAMVAGLALAARWSLHVAWADRLAQRETLAATQQAVRWMPGQAVYHFRLGILLADIDRARSVAALQRAVALNSADAAAWLELGLQLEAASDLERAERCLLRAAEVDRQYAPRWTLANYYFRRGETDAFWRWSKAAAAMVPVDATPLFRLCGSLVEDGRLLERLSITRPEIRANYLGYLLALGRLDLALGAARPVLAGGRETDVRLLLTACDRFLAAGRTDEAVEVWNGLVRQRRLAFPEVDTNGFTAVNAGFATSPTSRGFDWRLPMPPGVTAAAEEGRRAGLRLTFSGEQRETCEVLIQLIPVRPRTRYQFAFIYRTTEIAPETGLTWKVLDAQPDLLLAQSGSLSSESETGGTIAFETPDGCRMLKVALTYLRSSGTTRIAGAIVLRRAALAAAQ